MEIDINQQKISAIDKYKIFVNRHELYRATAELFRPFDRLYLFPIDQKKPKYKIIRKLTFFRTSYDIRTQDNHVFPFRTGQYIRGHYYCQAGQDRYDIYVNRGRRYSVYKNDVQVAWWDKEAVAWFKGDNYKIIADNDCHYELIISFCLIIDNAFNNNSGNSFVKVSFGRIGPIAREFDPTWRPK
jgi:hypothetical protein